MVRPNIALVFGLGTLILGACGGHEAEAPTPSGPPQDVKYRVLTTPQFAKPYVGKPVRTTAAFQMMPPQVGFPGKYANGWVGVTFGDVEPSASGEYACQAGAASPNLNMMVAGGVSVMAPTNIGQEFLSAKTGSVYELTGVLKENSTTYGGAYTMMFFEVTSLKVLAACKLQAPDVQAREGGVLSGLKELGGQKVLDDASIGAVRKIALEIRSRAGHIQPRQTWQARRGVGSVQSERWASSSARWAGRRKKTRDGSAGSDSRRETRKVQMSRSKKLKQHAYC